MADSELSRTHPLTIVVRSAKLAMQLVWGFIAFAIFSSSGGGLLESFGLLALIAAVIAFTIGISWLNWMFFLFGIVADDLVISEGWLIKKRRTIPLSRVQGIDIRADVVSRLLGVADVVIQTAGGGSGEAEARIGSIPLSQAEALRSGILHSREAAAVVGSETSIGADPLGRMSDLRGFLGGVEAGVQQSSFEYRLPFGRLVIAGITSNAVFISLAAGAGLIGQGFEMFSGPAEDALGALSSLALPVLIGLTLLGVAAVTVTAVGFVVARDYGFVVRRVADRLETEAGLFERRMTSMPVRRIQTLRVERTALRRLVGFTAVYADTAGFGRGEEQKSTTASAILPLARDPEVRPLLHGLLPEAERFPETRPVPRRALRFYILLPTIEAMLLTGLLLGVPTALLAPVIDEPVFSAVAPGAVAVLTVVAGLVTIGLRTMAFRAAEFGVDERALAISYGAVGRYSVRIGRSRIQSMAVRQSPFQRRAGLATLVVASVAGSSRSLYHVHHLELADATKLAEWYSPSRG